MSHEPEPDDPFGKRPGEVAIDLPADFNAGLYFIGTIHTPWKNRAECPKNPREAKGAICTIEVDARFRVALSGLERLSHLVVLYFMDRARRDLVLQVPRHLGEPRGTFALRSPARPNPVALSVVPLLKIEGTRLTVSGLDCLDGTPLLDLKPYYATVDGAGVEAAGTGSPAAPEG
ncbi:MAG: tRNA (N6-threonylcarbamoyladenosine(37)-N6)-methyltransferase TrmO [Xanthobacteraceae bacterium]